MSVQEAVSSEPSGSSAKGIPSLLDEMFTFVGVNFWKEDFGLSVVRGLKPEGFFLGTF